MHVIALSGRGKGFCGGYDLVASAEQQLAGLGGNAPPGSLNVAVQIENHDPGKVWDPVADLDRGDCEGIGTAAIHGSWSCIHPSCGNPVVSSCRAAPARDGRPERLGGVPDHVYGGDATEATRRLFNRCGAFSRASAVSIVSLPAGPGASSG